jgi:hypothetical protein
LRRATLALEHAEVETGATLLLNERHDRAHAQEEVAEPRPTGYRGLMLELSSPLPTDEACGCTILVFVRIGCLVNLVLA